MKAVLEFDMDLKEDRRKHMACVKAENLALIVWNIQTRLRGEIKYSESTNSEKDGIVRARDIVNDVIEEYGVNIEELLF